ncbi:hypothetical protein M569_05123, partial [Genlisea aurea]
FCNSSLPVDLVVTVKEVNFHVHKFPLTLRCGKMAALLEEEESQTVSAVNLEGFPGGADTFSTVVEFCYGSRVVFTPGNVVALYVAADYLEMSDDYGGEDNLLAKLEAFFHSEILKRWEGCVSALRSSEPLLAEADRLRLPARCIDAMSVMICTDPSLFGWPMRMYGSFQSPGGSILWNGINTGARIRSDESDWWFEDASRLGVELFERLIRAAGAGGVNPKAASRAIMHYCSKYLPGLGRRWQGGGSEPTTAGVVDQRALSETVIGLLPEKRGRSYCRFALGLLRVSSIVGASRECRDRLERRIGSQLEFATLDGLLIPNYYSDSDSETLYDSDCVERMLSYFVSSNEPPRERDGGSSSSQDRDTASPMKRVSKVVDGYLAEVASDVNLKAGKFRRLAESLPDGARDLHDGLYRALDIYIEAHPWLSEKEREHLCGIIDFRKLSMDACAHASQNERLPIRIVLQVLFFEQMHLRSAIVGYLNVLDPESSAPPPPPVGGWAAAARQNRDLSADMERMMSRVGELEEEFDKMKEEMRRMS